MPPEVKTSGCRKAKPTKGAERKKLWLFLSPFSGLVGLEAGGFNLWRWRLKLPLIDREALRANLFIAARNHR
jgi:hypothetical protein